MYIIDVIALVWVVIAITTIIIGSNVGRNEITINGIIILLSLILMSLAFQFGAVWQKIDIKEKYFLIEKQKPF